MTLLQIFITACGASLFTVVGQIIIKTMDIRHENKQKKDERNDDVHAALRGLYYDRIKEKAKTYIQRGYITTEELEDLEAMHKIYHNNLNGNGFLDGLMTTVRALPIKG